MTNPSPTISPYVIAIVDDEEDLRSNIAQFLQAQGFQVWTADSAENFYRQMVVTPTDLVIVDLGLPGEDGLSLIAHLRSSRQHAIIALTARGALADRIAGLEAGADYYFVKPIDLHELTAGIHAVSRKRPTPEITPLNSGAGAWCLRWEESKLVSPNGEIITLTSYEVRLLECLMVDAEKVISKRQLLELFDQHPVSGDFHRIEVLISRLRAKVVSVSGQRLPIRSIFAKGLAFVGRCTLRP